MLSVRCTAIVAVLPLVGGCGHASSMKAFDESGSFVSSAAAAAVAIPFDVEVPVQVFFDRGLPPGLRLASPVLRLERRHDRRNAYTHVRIADAIEVEPGYELAFTTVGTVESMGYQQRSAFTSYLDPGAPTNREFHLARLARAAFALGADIVVVTHEYLEQIDASTNVGFGMAYPHRYFGQGRGFGGIAYRFNPQLVARPGEAPDPRQAQPPAAPEFEPERQPAP